jgi:hypothetical protein
MLTRWCKTCHRSSQEVRFQKPSLCVDCSDRQAQEKARRLSILKPTPIATVREDGPDPDRSPQHLAWIRMQPCVVHGRACKGPIEAHHVREGLTGGTGLKPPDARCVPLCTAAHREGHTIGWPSFEDLHGVDLSAEADRLAALSPYLRKARAA